MILLLYTVYMIGAVIACPSVLLAGFPKCGTTSLHEMLTSHPEMINPNEKEPNFSFHCLCLLFL